MRSTAGAVGVTVALAAAALAAPPAPPVASPPVSLWYQNSLDWTDDPNHNSFLFVNAPLSHADAVKACASYNEQLVSSASAKGDKDLQQLMQYAVFRGDLTPAQSVWLQDGSAQLASGRVSVAPGVQGPARPALCTQSARGATQAESTFSPKLRVDATHSPSGNTYVGFRDLKSFRFLGVPFANPAPRFTYSSVASTRNAQVDATKLGPACFQPDQGSEDCLYLDIYSPYVPGASKDKSKLRPVLFWIHGGGYQFDYGSNPIIDGGNLASRGDIVVVSIDYRLGTLGFLAVPGTKITGNYGLSDQVTALQWVHQNIEAFGGDPNRVTIAGQSAGGASVRSLLASPKARGLFHGAVPASSPAGLGFAGTAADYQTPQQSYDTTGVKIVEAVGCANATDVAACLLKADALSLVKGPSSNTVVFDGVYIDTPRLDVWTPGKSAQVPVMIGAMSDENASLGVSFPAVANKTAALAGVLPASLVPVVDKSPLFPMPHSSNATLDVFNVTERVATDVTFLCLDQATAHTAAKNGVWPAAYYYRFDRSYLPVSWDSNYPLCSAPPTPTHPNGDPTKPYFNCHSGDLQLWFGTFGQFKSPFRDENDLPFAQHVLDSFVSFVRTHDPNPRSDFLLARGYTNTSKIYAQAGRWAPITKGADTLRRLDWPPRQTGFLELEQCKLLGLPVTYYDTLGPA